MTTHTLIIAEAGVNHDGSLEKALALVDAAADAGADIVKFQTFNAKALAGGAAKKADYQQRTTDAGESQLAMLERLELPQAAHETLIARAKERGIEFLSTPFDNASLDFLLSLRLSRLKIGSGDLTNAPLLHAAARGGAMLILSTGMATLGEVEEALGVLAHGYAQRNDPAGVASFRAAWRDPAARAAVARHVSLLHCTTEYPCPIADVNLAAMATMRSAFQLPVGYSDHTDGFEISVAAVALGASIVEKHLTLDRNALGPDHAASLEPDDFKRMVGAIRNVETALGDGVKTPKESEIRNVPVARKSIVAARALRAGEIIGPADITAKRPGTGRPPIDYWSLIGTAAPQALDPDDPV
ncbi:N-acetylneuraminate synthase [Bradyrhizobium sp. R2.2-H]|jgi:N-acetylneuraminate synthase|uniref:N-acetylneuraminate synthase n=1 Tax=unclassified Bradyrhizobium TaxID=2631580 RepID=UPI0010517206|nr:MULTISPECIES: N-acetylneuraminate synthase [unclassified Bradyrhizobium]TCU64656.1 N-acetylneuraminate synthase [Bradyrhizobium sp. Y-H1]TCU66845.1 N-acetylneuraminate synthase [Bradyrhizobium sp. R2.2-H]